MNSAFLFIIAHEAALVNHFFAFCADTNAKIRSKPHPPAVAYDGGALMEQTAAVWPHRNASCLPTDAYFKKCRPSPEPPRLFVPADASLLRLPGLPRQLR